MRSSVRSTCKARGEEEVGLSLCVPSFLCVNRQMLKRRKERKTNKTPRLFKGLFSSQRYKQTERKRSSADQKMWAIWFFSPRRPNYRVATSKRAELEVRIYIFNGVLRRKSRSSCKNVYHHRHYHPLRHPFSLTLSLSCNFRNEEEDSRLKAVTRE